MDLVSRIELFMEHKGISRSQFADRCGIARPTLTQLLNGHNKKVSDDILKRIHASYPELSMMWLVFGEGDMLTQSNSRFSEPKIPLNGNINNSQRVVKEALAIKEALPTTNSEIIDFAPEIGGDVPYRDSVPSSDYKSVADSEIPGASGVTSAGKKIRHIMVFYTDNSYEIFTPSDKH